MARRGRGRNPASAGLALYAPGASRLHSAPAGRKLIALLALGLALALAPPRWHWALGSSMLAALVAVGLATRLPLGPVARALRGVALLVIAAGAYQWWRAGWETAVGVSTTLLALILAGLIVTMTTPMEATIDVVVRISRPLRRVGLDPEWLGLAVALMLRGVPSLVEVFGQTRDAARARGLERDPRATLVPAVLRTVSRARLTGEALAARGIAD